MRLQLLLRNNTGIWQKFHEKRKIVPIVNKMTRTAGKTEPRNVIFRGKLRFRDFAGKVFCRNRGMGGRMYSVPFA